MHDLKIWENKIKEKRAHTSFRDFLKDIASNIPFMLYKTPQWISRFPQTERIKIFNNIEYEKERDTLIKRGNDYDFGINFFQNYKNLREKVWVCASMQDPKGENIAYGEAVRFSKNVYLSFIVIKSCENIFYTFYSQEECRNVLNSVMVWDHSEIVYFSTAILKSYKIFYSRYIVNCNNIWFSSNLIGCSECIFCDNLHNKSYCIENKEYEKEEYFAKKEHILKNKEKFQEYYNEVNKEAENLSSENVSGNFCVYSENVENWYFCYRLQNARNAFFVGHSNGRKNVLDTICSDDPWFWDLYGCSNMWSAENCYLSNCFIGTNLYYCYDLLDCNHCIGCISLRNKSFCILNKQYLKEEWLVLANKIFSSMEKDWILWEAFPPSLNPLYFNDTLAYLFGDFDKDEITDEGFMWRNEEVKVDISETAEIVYVNSPILSDIPLNKGDSQSGGDILEITPTRSSLPPQLRGTEGEFLDSYQGFDSSENWKINPEILKKVIRDSSGNYYKIIKPEYDFLEKYALPLPELHWLERIKVGLKK